MDEELSPRRLLALLSPRLPLDAELVADWRLFDCYRLSDTEPVRVELRRGEGSGQTLELLRVNVEPEPAGGFPHRMPAQVAGLGLSYPCVDRSEPARGRSASGDAAGPALCQALAAVLEAELGSSARRWHLREPGLAGLAKDVEAEVEVSAATLAREPDAALLARDFDHYERLYGVRPEVRRVRVRGRDVRGISVHYPAAQNGTVPNSAAVYARPLRIAHRRRMRRYFGELGCAFDLGAHPRTVPTPTTFARSLRERRGLARVRPRMIAGVSASLLPIHWGSFVRRNLLPVSVAPAWAVAVHARRRMIGPLAQIPCDVGMLVHDMGVHALGLHAVPAAAWDELVSAATAMVRARPHSLLMGRFGLLAKLAGFFENTVTTACWSAWAQTEEPEDFAAAYAPAHAELRRTLDDL